MQTDINANTQSNCRKKVDAIEIELPKLWFKAIPYLIQSRSKWALELVVVIFCDWALSFEEYEEANVKCDR